MLELKYNGDKSAKGMMAGPHVISALTNGVIISDRGVRVGTYRRVLTDGGVSGNQQVIEISLEGLDN